MDRNLEKRILALEKWKKEKESQQIVFPLDDDSRKIAYVNSPIFTGRVIQPFSLSPSPFYTVEVRIPDRLVTKKLDGSFRKSNGVYWISFAGKY
jgi:hypothetical protein